MPEQKGYGKGRRWATWCNFRKHLESRNDNYICGISKANKLLINPIKNTVRKRAFKTSMKVLKVSVSKFTSKLGVVGAALIS